MCTHLDILLNTIPTIEGDVSEGSKKVFLAFSKDMTSMDNKIKMLSEEIKSVKNDVADVRSDVADVKTQVCNVEGKIDSVLELVKSRFNSTVDEERLTGAMVNRILKSKKLWIGLVIVMLLLVLAGTSISYFLDRATDVSILVDSVSKLK